MLVLRLNSGCEVVFLQNFKDIAILSCSSCIEKSKTILISVLCDLKTWRLILLLKVMKFHSVYIYPLCLVFDESFQYANSCLLVLGNLLFIDDFLSPAFLFWEQLMSHWFSRTRSLSPLPQPHLSLIQSSNSLLL